MLHKTKINGSIDDTPSPLSLPPAVFSIDMSAPPGQSCAVKSPQASSGAQPGQQGSPPPPPPPVLQASPTIEHT